MQIEAMRVQDRSELNLTRFAESLGVSPKSLPESCVELIERLNFRYRILAGQERDEVIVRVLRTLDADLPKSGQDRLGRWEEGWNENLRAFIASGYDIKELLPRYYVNERRVMRLFGQYIVPENPSFETDYLSVLQRWIALTFLRDVENVYEFGCGPGHNLVAFSSVFPNKTYWGLDWAASSQRVVETIAKAKVVDHIWASRFDMFSPDHNFTLEKRSAVVTFGAMEQLGTDFAPFLNYIIEQKPDICVHVEPLHELYNPESLGDYMASRYAEKRGYLRGFLSELDQLENEEKIRIVHLQRNLGSLYHDGWSTIAWQFNTAR